MKKITPVALIVIIGCLMVILVAVYFIQTSKTLGHETSISPPTTPSINTTKSGIVQTPVPVGIDSSNGIKGPLSVSLGDYNAKMPVLIDNTNLGEVSRGKPLNISVNEGYHVVKICLGDVCEQVGVEVKSAIKTTIDFGERLKTDIRQGPLTVSLGSYNAELPVFIDNSSVGNVSRGKLLNISVSEGRHVVRVCIGSVCKQQEVEIKSTKQTTVDFGEQIQKDISKGPLTISIGGYNAELPVSIDNSSVGIVSLGKPLQIMVSEGRHTVKVCVGVICFNESVEIKFAQPTFVDFGERLKKDVEFTQPTVRIVSSVLNINRLSVSVEFINPDKIDHTMSATIGGGYSYVDSNTRERKNEFAQTMVTRSVKAGTRVTQLVDLSLSRGSSVIASEPTVVEVIVT